MKDSPAADRPSWRVLAGCALRRRCPRCREGALFKTWYTLHRSCPGCGYALERTEGSTWFLMYASSGAVVGIAFLYMLFFPPEDALTGWLTIVPGAAMLLFLTLPFRKAMAIVFDYYLDPGEAAEPAENRPNQ